MSFTNTIALYLESMRSDDDALFRSVPNGPGTLYGTCYAALLAHYIDSSVFTEDVERVILDAQSQDDGFFYGPELTRWNPPSDAKHDRDHILMHLACAVIPVLQQYEVPTRFPLLFAERFCDLRYLRGWLARRSLSDAWLEGNNLLFVGQTLLYLRDVAHHPGADVALNYWFRWHDDRLDPNTGLWGTDGHCSNFVAMCGAYHQFLLYAYEGRPIGFAKELVDTVLDLQHDDGGFAPRGGGGACEDADAVYILASMTKTDAYRRDDITAALTKCFDHILALQNPDGGFPYNKTRFQSHMGIEDTKASAGISTMFATWFRVHTIAMIADVVGIPSLSNSQLRFNKAPSMGWFPT